MATTTHMHASLCTCVYFRGLLSSLRNSTGQRCIYRLADGDNLLEEAYSIGEGTPDFSWVMGPFENTMKAFTFQDLGSWKRYTSTNPTMTVPDNQSLFLVPDSRKPTHVCIPYTFQGISERLHQTEQVFHESGLGTGTGKGDVGVGRGKDHWGEAKHEKRTGWRETVCEAAGRGGSGHGIA